MSDNPNTITLKHSIPIPKEGGGIMNVNELTMGRFKLKHLKLLPDDFAEREGKLNPQDMIPLIGGLFNIGEEAAGEIDFEDLEKVVEKISKITTNFLASSPETGEK